MKKQQTTQKEKQFLGALHRAIIADAGERLRKAAEALLDHAAAGEYWAINMLADRLDGKPTQQLQALDEEGRSVAVGLIMYAPREKAIEEQEPLLPSAIN